MKPVPILLVLSLAGCLGSAPESPEPGTDEVGLGTEPPGVRDPVACVPSSSPPLWRAPA